jgi:hypothetical protein
MFSTSFQISQDLPTHIILAVIVIFPTGISTLHLYFLSHVMNSSVTMARVYKQFLPATLGPIVVREKTTVDVEVRIFKIMHSSRYLSIIFLSMCDVKIFLTFTSPNMVLL